MKRLFKEKTSRSRILPLIIMMVLSLGLITSTADAAASIRKVEYEGNGKVDVDFASRVTYKGLKLVVKDSKGNTVKSSILDKDSDDLEFKISNYKYGKKYSFTIKGIKKKGDSEYGNVSGSVKLPKNNGSIPIKEIDYDSDDNEVSFEFDTSVKWKSPKVKIKKGSKNYVKYIEDKDSTEIDVIVKKLERGTTYKYTISGIKKNGADKFTTISGSFTP